MCNISDSDDREGLAIVGCLLIAIPTIALVIYVVVWVDHIHDEEARSRLSQSRLSDQTNSTCWWTNPRSTRSLCSRVVGCEFGRPEIVPTCASLDGTNRTGWCDNGQQCTNPVWDSCQHAYCSEDCFGPPFARECRAACDTYRYEYPCGLYKCEAGFHMQTCRREIAECETAFIDFVFLINVTERVLTWGLECPYGEACAAAHFAEIASKYGLDTDLPCRYFGWDPARTITLGEMERPYVRKPFEKYRVVILILMIIVTTGCVSAGCGLCVLIAIHENRSRIPPPATPVPATPVDVELVRLPPPTNPADAKPIRPPPPSYDQVV